MTCAAYTGIAGHEHNFRCAEGHDSVDGRKQHFNLTLPPVQLLRDQQPVRRIVRARATGRQSISGGLHEVAVHRLTKL
jgi:hypothetical protein